MSEFNGIVLTGRCFLKNTYSPQNSGANKGNDDADTLTLGLLKSGGLWPIEHIVEGASTGKTHAFDGAHTLRANGTQKFVLAPISGLPFNANARIRLIGVDAPELHYAGRNDSANQFGEHYIRQRAGRAAAIALHAKMKAAAGADNFVTVSVRCRATNPADAMDSFGRFLGEVFLNDESLNEWLLREGFAMFSGYDNTHPDDLTRFKAAAQSAKKKNLRARFTQAWVPLERLVETDAHDGDGGTSPFLHPKIYRRQVDAAFVGGLLGDDTTPLPDPLPVLDVPTFHAFLKARNDQVIKLADFKNGVLTKKKMADLFFSTGRAKVNFENWINVTPPGLVSAVLGLGGW